MIKKILVITLLISLMIFSGCAKKTEVSEQKTPTGTTDSTGSAIDDASSVSSDIEDPATEKQLDDVSNTLNNW